MIKKETKKLSERFITHFSFLVQSTQEYGKSLGLEKEEVNNVIITAIKVMYKLSQNLR